MWSELVCVYMCVKSVYVFVCECWYFLEYFITVTHLIWNVNLYF